MAQHLLDLGHRRIAVASGSRELTTVVDRLEGAAKAWAGAGLAGSQIPIVEAPFTREGGKVAAEQILAEHPEVTAILALNDDMAIGVLSVLRSRGIDVPGRISVAGFDDVAVAQDLAPSLTTVRLPMGSNSRSRLRLTM